MKGGEHSIWWSGSACILLIPVIALLILAQRDGPDAIDKRGCTGGWVTGATAATIVLEDVDVDFFSI